MLVIVSNRCKVLHSPPILWCRSSASDYQCTEGVCEASEKRKQNVPTVLLSGEYGL